MYEKYMRLAIEEAKKGEGFVNPNPLVGAVIVKDGKILGTGYHKKYGENHAEINAILDAKKKNNNIENATIYINLEPCSHYGKTPPCADAIIKNKFKRAVIGCLDSNIKVVGNGIKKLREAKIEVVENILEEDCKKLNEVFFHYINTKKPFMVMKYAMTMDGKIASVSGKSKWITSEKSREHAHLFRKKYSAIMVGINTVIEDNPTLNCRIKDNPKNPIRIILDSDLKIDLKSNICKTSKDIKTYIASVKPTVKSNKNTEKKKELEYLGIEIIETSPKDSSKDYKVNLQELIKILGEEKNIDSVLIEGGATLHAALLKEKLIDKALIYIAPKIFGGLNAKTPIAGEGIEEPDNAIKLIGGKLKNIGEDLFMEYYLKY